MAWGGVWPTKVTAADTAENGVGASPGWELKPTVGMGSSHLSVLSVAISNTAPASLWLVSLCTEEPGSKASVSVLTSTRPAGHWHRKKSDTQEGRLSPAWNELLPCESYTPVPGLPGLAGPLEQC